MLIVINLNRHIQTGSDSSLRQEHICLRIQNRQRHSTQIYIPVIIQGLSVLGVKKLQGNMALHMDHIVYHSFFFFWLSFQWSLFLYLRKDYSLESELKRLRESSLGNMNQIEPKIKLSSLPLFQSCPLEYMSIKLFISVFLSDLFSGLSDPWNQVSQLVNQKCWSINDKGMTFLFDDIDFNELKINSKIR